jgi:hypothetical protein
MEQFGMKLNFFISVSIILISFASAQLGPRASKPEDGHKYELEIQKVELMNKTDFVVFEGLKVKRYNKTVYVADGQFTFNIDFNDEWSVEAKTFKNKGGNQWDRTGEKLMLQIEQKIKFLLSAFETNLKTTSKFIEDVYIEGLYKDLGPFSNLPEFKEDDPLVFPKGTYHIDNYYGDVRNFPPYLTDGTYRIEIKLYNEGIIKCGFIVYWKVYPEIG